MIDLGLEGGDGGGEIVAGAAEDIVKYRELYGKFLAGVKKAAEMRRAAVREAADDR